MNFDAVFTIKKEFEKDAFIRQLIIELGTKNETPVDVVNADFGEVRESVIDALSFLTIFGMIGIFATMFFGFLLFVIKKAKEKFKALTCNKCNKLAEIKTPEEFAKYISFTVGKNEAVFKGVSHPASNNGVVDNVTATASASVNVVIELKCPHCGEVKKLNYAISPFKCTAKQTKVAVRDVEFVKANLENKVRAVVADYNSDRRENIPYSIHKHPLCIFCGYAGCRRSNCIRNSR